MDRKGRLVPVAAGLAAALGALLGCPALPTIELGQVLHGHGRHVAEITGRPDHAPFFPLGARVDAAGGMAAKGSFLAADQCVTCHEDHFKEWSQSIHARAWTDRFYRALLTRVVADGGPAYRQACTGCHTPAGVLEGVVPGTLDERELGDAAREGVTCHVCHSIDSLRGPAHGQALLFDPGEGDSMRTMRGPFVSDTADFHKAEASELHESGELCASCHDVFHPVYRFRLETPYQEWRASPYAAAGVQCQDCHMSADGGDAARRLERPVPRQGPVVEGGPDRPLHYHGFPGPNLAISAMVPPGGTASKKKDRAFREHQALGEKLLLNAARVHLEAPASVDPGSTVDVGVDVENSGTGHNLPTGVDMVRELWLAFEATDASGKVLYGSGALDHAGRVDPEAPRFGRTFVDDQGRRTIEPWRARAIRSDTTIPSKKHARAHYSLVLPADVAFPVHVTATLRMRVAPQDLFDRYMGAETVALPIVDLASAHGELHANRDER